MEMSNAQTFLIWEIVAIYSFVDFVYHTYLGGSSLRTKSFMRQSLQSFTWGAVVKTVESSSGFQAEWDEENRV